MVSQTEVRAHILMLRLVNGVINRIIVFSRIFMFLVGEESMIGKKEGSKGDDE